jgi:hypothetical protein
MEIDGNQKEQLRGKRSSSGLSQSIRHYKLMRTKRGWNRGEKRREVVYFFQSTCHGKRRAIGRSDTQETTCAQLLVGYVDSN